MAAGVNGGKSGALAPVRICDFSGQLAGAGATRFFAAFGAQVVRIEDRLSQGGWDIFRGNGPYKDARRGTNLGGMFNNHNIEKLGVTLNAKSERGKAVLRDIIAISDVVTENFSAGVMERWGFPYEEMVRIKPDIIYVSNCGFGHEGPYRHFKTWGPVVQAVSGLTFQSGLPGMPPAGWGFSHMDHTGGYFMAIAILAALYHRNKTGEGQYVDLSCTDAALTLNGPALLDYTINGRPLRREGMPHSNRSEYPPMSPHGIYRSRGTDRWVAIAARDNADWRAICEVMGNGGLADDERFATIESRMARQDELDGLMEGWTSGRTAREAMDALQARGVPAAVVQHPEERMDEDANTLAWGTFPEVEHGEMGRVRVEGMPMRMSKTPAAIERGAPLLGEHNDFFYDNVLALSKATQRELYAEGVI